jgi:predicted lipoprotein
MYFKTLLSFTLTLSVSGCIGDNENVPAIDDSFNGEILNEFSSNVVQSVYNNLASKTSTFYDQVLALETDGATDAELTACRTTWKQARESWELSESFLFGPVSTDNIDPRIDTWPVNFTDLDAQLASSAEFNETYINNLEDALKGFHPIEYLIFGAMGQKAASELSARDIEYLKGLTSNLKSLTSALKSSWNPSTTDNYHVAFTQAGNGSTVYSTQLAAFEELVNSMIGICDEVANGKINEVFLAQDPSLEESPFAKNSITDFTNNIKGVQNVYLGKFATDGKGLEDLVRRHNLQLDNEIKLKLNNALTALGNVTDPFGEAISTQPIQVQNAIDAINDLKDTLELQLLQFVQQHSK